MHFAISIENLSKDFVCDWLSLHLLTESIKLLYPGDETTVQIDITYANKYLVDRSAGHIIPDKTLVVSIYPLTGPVERSNLTEDYVAVARQIADLAFEFLKKSEKYRRPIDVRVSPGFSPITFNNLDRSFYWE